MGRGDSGRLITQELGWLKEGGPCSLLLLVLLIKKHQPLDFRTTLSQADLISRFLSSRISQVPMSKQGHVLRPEQS